MKRLFFLSNLMLTALVVFLGVRIFYTLASAGFKQPPPRVSPVPAGEAKREKPPPDPADYSVIVTRNLFSAPKKAGKDVSSGKTAAAPSKKAPPGLKLWGTVKDENGEAFAVIEDADRIQRLYRKGDKVGGMTLSAVDWDRAVLAAGGENLALVMEPPVPGARALSPAEETAAAIPPDSQRITVSRGLINQAMNNVNDLLGQISITAHTLEGKPDGLALSGIQSGSLFSRMGLENGDIIVGVDSRPIKTMDDAIDLYNSLKNSDQAALNLRRGGRPRTLFYTIK